MVTIKTGYVLLHLSVDEEHIDIPLRGAMVITGQFNSVDAARDGR